MKRLLIGRLGFITPVILTLLIFGCATTPSKPPSEAPPELPAYEPSPYAPEPSKPPEKVTPFSIFPERYRRLAMEHEKRGELPRAVQCWEVVLAFQPSNKEARDKLTSLKSKIEALADQHFKKGLSFYQSHTIAAARKEFLLTLYYNPNHPEALSYLKYKLLEEEHVLYEVNPGDTLKSIAEKIYHDPEKDFLIASFNSIRNDTPLTPKSILYIPLLEEAPQTPPAKPAPGAKEIPTAPSPKEATVEPKETKDRKETMGKALAFFKANRFKETVSITEEILSTDPSNKTARDLTNASYYQMGKAFHQQKKYKEALDNFEHVESGYKDTPELAAQSKKLLAETHYVLGIKYFTEEKLDQAIHEWEETLKFNPQHPKAKGDMEKAVKLLQKLNEIK